MKTLDEVFHFDHADGPLRTALDAACNGPGEPLERVARAAKEYARATRMDAGTAAGSRGVQVAGRFCAALFRVRACDVQNAALRGLYEGARDLEPKQEKVTRIGGWGV